MNKKNILLLIILSGLYLTACASDLRIEDDPTLQNANTEQNIVSVTVSATGSYEFFQAGQQAALASISTDELSETINEDIENNEDFFVENSEIAASDADVNPYDNPYLTTFWHHDIFELFRGACRVEFSETLEYSVSASLEANTLMSLNAILPQINAQSQFALAFNDYYISRLDFLRGIEDQLWSKAFEDNIWWSHRYNQVVQYAYIWGDIYSVIIEEVDERANGNSSTESPLCDNFSITTGLRLTLDDIFTVCYDEYSLRLSESLKKPETDYPQILEPRYENGAQRIPLPARENFMLTPNGIALIYHRYEIAFGSEGVVILYVDYEDVKDILSTGLGLVE